jgi:Flp pilus assembly protein TadD
MSTRRQHGKGSLWKISSQLAVCTSLCLPAAGWAQGPANPFREGSGTTAKPTSAEIHRLALAVKASPSSASAHTDLGIALAESEQWQQALGEFTIAHKVDPENAEAIYDTGLTRLMMARAIQDHRSTAYDDQLDQAEQALLQALQTDPTLPRIYEYLGWIYHQIGDQDSAIQLFRKEVELNPSSPEALNNLATSLAQTENYQEAIKCYEDALAIDAKCTSCLLNLESAIRSQGDTNSALKRYEAQMQSQPDSALAHLLYGMTLTVLQSRQDAAMAELHSALRVIPELAAAHYYLGQIQHENQNDTAAEAEYRTATKLDPDRPEFLAALASILLQEGKTAEARVILEKALSFEPENPSLHYKLSVVLQRSGEEGRAATERAETARLERQDLDQSKLAMNLKHGIANLRAGNATDAVRDLQTALALDPNHPETNFYLGIALSQTGDPTGSSQAFRRALERRPESAEFHYNFGIALWQSGQSSPAIIQFRRVTAIRPEDGMAHCALGIALVRTGDPVEGLREIAQAKRLGACEQKAQ